MLRPEKSEAIPYTAKLLCVFVKSTGTATEPLLPEMHQLMAWEFRDGKQEAFS